VGSADCGGNFNDVNVGCPGYLTIAKWQANIRIEVVDPGNQQIYLPAFPHSTPIVNLNLTNFPGRPGAARSRGKHAGYVPVRRQKQHQHPRLSSF
jgi:hypothetical protein